MDDSYKYEVRAAKLPLVSDVKNPQEGERARTQTGVILVYRSGQWFYE